VSSLDALLQSEASGFLLETVRISGLIVVAPLPWTMAPLRARAVLVLALALAAHGASPVAPNVGSSSALVAFSVGSEFLLGAALGFVFRLLMAVAEIMADVVAPQIGFGAAQMFDPQTHSTQTALTSVFRNLALLLALLVGVHRVLIGAVLQSFRLIPPGAVSHAERSVPVLLALGSQTLDAGVRMALPVIAILFMTQVALALISRAAPAMQIFSIGFAVTLSVGTLVLVLVLPDFAQEFVAEASHTGARIETLFAAFGAQP
jgi:flagellar biosynthetic protein FliR